MRLEPTNIQQIGDELAIAWNNGKESFFNLETLRRAFHVQHAVANRMCSATSRGRT